MTATQEKLIIAPSQELFFEAISTLPGTPYKGVMGFCADGLFHTYPRCDDKAFIAECAKRGIIPGSLSLSYSCNTEIIKSGKSGYWQCDSDVLPFVHSSGHETSAMQNTKIGMIIRGGRIHEFEVDAGAHGVPSLRDHLVPQLIANGYQIGSGSFVYSRWGSKNDRYPSEDGTQVLFRQKEGLEIALAPDADHLSEQWKNPEDKDALMSWFQGLRKTFGK